MKTLTKQEEGFIQQTADDYDLPFDLVKNEYLKYNSNGNFYAYLEIILKEKAQS